MKKVKVTVNWRIIWYSVLVWVTAFFVGSFIFLPWFYVILPLFILLLTVYYFDTKNIGGGAVAFANLPARQGLAVAIAWFFTIALFSLMEIVGFYYFDFVYYFSDLRNWFLYPLVLLIPVVYGIILENSETKKSRNKRSKRVSFRKTWVGELSRKSALS